MCYFLEFSDFNLIIKYQICNRLINILKNGFESKIFLLI